MMWLGICKRKRHMRLVLRIFSCALFLALCGPLARAQGGDVLVPISKYIEQGDAESLSAWFADNLEIGILRKETTSSRNQARQITRNFFEEHTPRSFSITHIAGKAGLKYALGSLNAGGEVFSVTIFLSCKDDDIRIQQLKIER